MVDRLTLQALLPFLVEAAAENNSTSAQTQSTKPPPSNPQPDVIYTTSTTLEKLEHLCQLIQNKPGLLEALMVRFASVRNPSVSQTDPDNPIPATIREEIPLNLIRALLFSSARDTLTEQMPQSLQQPLLNPDTERLMIILALFHNSAALFRSDTSTTNAPTPCPTTRSDLLLKALIAVDQLLSSQAFYPDSKDALFSLMIASQPTLHQVQIASHSLLAMRKALLYTLVFAELLRDAPVEDVRPFGPSASGRPTAPVGDFAPPEPLTQLPTQGGATNTVTIRHLKELLTNFSLLDLLLESDQIKRPGFQPISEAHINSPLSDTTAQTAFTNPRLAHVMKTLSRFFQTCLTGRAASQAEPQVDAFNSSLQSLTKFALLYDRLQPSLDGDRLRVVTEAGSRTLLINLHALQPDLEILLKTLFRERRRCTRKAAAPLNAEDVFLAYFFGFLHFQEG